LGGIESGQQHCETADPAENQRCHRGMGGVCIATIFVASVN
jgi:hypothetical protein